MSSINSRVRLWKINDLGPGCSFLWILPVIYFPVKHSCLFNEMYECTVGLRLSSAIIRDLKTEVFLQFPRTANVNKSGLRFEVHVCTARPRSRGKWFNARFFCILKNHNTMFERTYDFFVLVINFCFIKHNFKDNFLAKIEVSGWMKTNMAAASYHPRILSAKYGQTGNVKRLTANRSLMAAVKWPNLDLI